MQAFRLSSVYCLLWSRHVCQWHETLRVSVKHNSLWVDNALSGQCAVFFSTLCAPSVRRPSWELVTMRRKGWPTVRSTTIRWALHPTPPSVQYLRVCLFWACVVPTPLQQPWSLHPVRTVRNSFTVMLLRWQLGSCQSRIQPGAVT